MVLTPLTADFWINFYKNDINGDYEEKIIKEDICISIKKFKNSYHSISCCQHGNSNFDGFYDNIIKIINDKIKTLQIKDTLGIEWIIRQNDSPKILPEKLLSKGYEKIVSSRTKMGIKLDSYQLQPTINNNFEIKEVSFEKMLEEPIINLILNNFSKLFTSKQDIKEKLTLGETLHEKKGNDRFNFIAYTKKDHKPIASGNLLIRNDIPGVAYLSGAITDKEYRKKGIYTSMLLTRIKRCKELGLQYVIVDADPLTSGPILEKFGFKVIETIDIYRLNFT